MGQDNESTLHSYDGHVRDYVNGTSQVVSGASKDWIDAALDGLPSDAAILEVGSGVGRDAAYIQQQGYVVECTDASQGFLEHLRANGFQARAFNALTDTLEDSYDLIIANAVLLHFGREDVRRVVDKLADALRPGGRLAFSLKQGNGEEWSSKKLNAPRYFCYWQPEQLVPLLRQAGFVHWDVQAIATHRQHADWIYVIATI